MAANLVRTKALSQREKVMEYVWKRLMKAWEDEDDEQAQKLNRMYEAFEAMTDEDWIAAYEDVHPQDV